MAAGLLISFIQIHISVRMLKNSSLQINIDCKDPLGRTALLMAIDNENMEIMELLLENKVGCMNI